MKLRLVLICVFFAVLHPGRSSNLQRNHPGGTVTDPSGNVITGATVKCAILARVWSAASTARSASGSYYHFRTAHRRVTRSP